uniref:Uncharacterized protein n=1 Tax=Panagrolaimus sp. PS1159 TaxID=55785 RepID=A0AC35GPL5_9BILA
MVKTPRGRKPGSRHERIVKQLRHRRRMAGSRAQHSLDSTSTSNSTCSTASSTSISTSIPITVRAAEMKYVPTQYPRYFTLSEIDQLLSMNEDSDAIVEKVDDAQNAENDKQIVLWKVGGGGKVNRGISEAAVVGPGSKNCKLFIFSG